MDVYHAGFEILTLESVPATDAAAVVLGYVNALVTTNAIYLRHYPHTPPLYLAGVRYRRQRLGSDRWIDIPRVLQERAGSCEDLVAWRVAELQAQGESATATVTFDDIHPATGKPLTLVDGRPFTLYHVLVRRGDGSIEDPSALLGMHETPHNLPIAS